MSPGVDGLSLRLLPGCYAVARLPIATELVGFSQLYTTVAAESSPREGPTPLLSVTRIGDELSVVAPEESLCVVAEESAEAGQGAQVESGWRALEVAGPLDFGLVGILASLVDPLARAGVSVFSLSTFDTDYVLVKAKSLEMALSALEGAGHAVEETSLVE